MSATDPIPYGRCHCGCGGKTPLALSTNATRGHRRGEPLRFLHGHNARKALRYVEQDHGYYTRCWVWQLATHADDGHGRIDVGGRLLLAHRVYYEQKHGPLPHGLHLHHRCEMPSCVNPDHLEPMTPAAHRREHSRLDWNVVGEIRQARAAGATLSVLSERFGVSVGHLSAIVNDKAWVA